MVNGVAVSRTELVRRFGEQISCVACRPCRQGSINVGDWASNLLVHCSYLDMARGKLECLVRPRMLRQCAGGGSLDETRRETKSSGGLSYRTTDSAIPT